MSDRTPPSRNSRGPCTACGGGVRAAVLRNRCKRYMLAVVFFFNDTATTEIYTLSLHDALPISKGVAGSSRGHAWNTNSCSLLLACSVFRDRKSTCLNSSDLGISYAVFC